MKVSGTHKKNYELLNKRLEYLQTLLFDSMIKKLAVLNKDREFFHYTGGAHLTWQLVKLDVHFSKIFTKIFFLV